MKDLVWTPHKPGLNKKLGAYWKGERAERITRRRLHAQRVKGRSKLRVAFTGTRRGCSERQLVRLRKRITKLLKLYGADHLVFVHGACMGADEQFHRIAIKCGAQKIEQWPSTAATSRAEACKRRAQRHGVKLVSHRPKPPMDRNADIIKGAFILLACPKESREQVHSGTWSTVRIARHANIPVRILKP